MDGIAPAALHTDFIRKAQDKNRRSEAVQPRLLGYSIPDLEKPALLPQGRERRLMG